MTFFALTPVCLSCYMYINKLNVLYYLAHKFCYNIYFKVFIFRLDIHVICLLLVTYIPDTVMTFISINSDYASNGINMYSWLINPLKPSDAYMRQ